jgi:hypothetical protein
MVLLAVNWAAAGRGLDGLLDTVSPFFPFPEGLGKGIQRMSFWDGQRPWGRSVGGVAPDGAGCVTVGLVQALRPARSGTLGAGLKPSNVPCAATITTARRLVRPHLVAVDFGIPNGMPGPRQTNARPAGVAKTRWGLSPKCDGVFVVPLINQTRTEPARRALALSLSELPA